VLTLSRKAINPSIARWFLELENYDYSIMHRPCVNIDNVDSLSRQVEIIKLLRDGDFGDDKGLLESIEDVPLENRRVRPLENRRDSPDESSRDHVVESPLET